MPSSVLYFQIVQYPLGILPKLTIQMKLQLLKSKNSIVDSCAMISVIESNIYLIKDNKVQRQFVAQSVDSTNLLIGDLILTMILALFIGFFIGFFVVYPD